MCATLTPNCNFGSAAVCGGAPVCAQHCHHDVHPSSTKLPLWECGGERRCSPSVRGVHFHHDFAPLPHQIATLGVRPVCGGGPVRARCQLLMVKLSPPAGSKRARIIKLIRRDGWRAPPIDPRHPMVLLWFFLLQRHLHSMPYAQSQATKHICLLLFNGYYSMFLQIVTTIK
jgi:hypothetical protein